MRMFMPALLGATAIGIVLPAASASAQEAAAETTTSTRFNGTSDQNVEEIVVTGRSTSANGVTNTTPGGGLMAVQTGTKLRSTVTRDYLDKLSGTTNVFTAIRNLPGVVLGSGDPAGTSANLSIRGLSQTSLGFNFEGMPIGDQLSYSAFPGEWADTENVGMINLTRGSTDITAPVYNSVGALLQEELISPSHTAGGYATVALGNNDLNRQFLRLETGDIGDTGIRGFVSASRTFFHTEKGPGRTRRHHIDSKFVKEFEGGSTVSLVATYNEEASHRGRNPTKAQFEQFGRGFTFDDTYTPGNANYYGLRVADRQSLYVSAPSNIVLNDSLELSVTPYMLYTHGIINGASNLNLTNAYYGEEFAGPLQAPGATGTTATVMNVDYYNQNTYGQNSFLKWTTGTSQFRVGYWYSNFVHTERAAFQVADANGNVRDPYGRKGSVLTADGEILRNFQARIEQNVHGLYADWTGKFMDDRLLVNAGFKYVWVDRVATSEVPGPNQRVTSISKKPLPQFSVRYSFDDRNQIFADVTTAFRAPSAVSSYVNIYSVATGRPSSTPSDNFSPEYSVGEEIGFRHHGDLVHFTIAAFNYDLSDRLVQGSQIVDGTSVGFAVNVGDQSARGIEVELGMVPYKGFSPYISAQYLDAETKDDYPVNGQYLPTAGKRAVLSPEFVMSGGLSYDDGALFARIDGNYVGSQYATFMNDEKMPSFAVGNLAIGYRFDSTGPLKKPQVQMNVTNFTNEKYLAGIQGVRANALATQSRSGSTVAGSSPTYLVGGGIGAILSVSSAF